MPQIQNEPYVITAHTKNGFIQQTRLMAASAVVLAKELQGRGNTVELRDPTGDLVSPEKYEGLILKELSKRRPSF